MVYGRSRAAEHGTVLARTAAGQRLMVRVGGTDAATLAVLAVLAVLTVLTDLDQSPIGRSGRVSMGADGLLRWAAG